MKQRQKLAERSNDSQINDSILKEMIKIGPDNTA